MPQEDSTLRRWTVLLSRLNAIELRGRSDRERVAWRGYLADRLGPSPERRLDLRPLTPEPGAADDAEPAEQGPPCPRCAVTLSQERALVACSVCLAVWHRDCGRAWEPCPSPGCGG